MACEGVRTNETSVQYAIEESLGVLPASPEWKLTEPNAINDFGATITTVQRSPISKNRQNQKGTITDLDSQFNYDADVTIDSYRDFISGFVFADAQGADIRDPSAVSTTAYTVDSGATVAQYTLVYGRGFTNAANNGLKEVDTGATTTSIPVAGGGLVTETPPANAEVAIAGYRGETGDLEIDASGNLISTLLDFTTLPLVAGQAIWIGGEALVNRFDTVADRGYARIVSISANELVLDKRQQTYTVDAGAGKNIDIYFGQYYTNVAVDDVNYLETSYQFEVAYPNLEGAGVDGYEYAKGNIANTLTVNMPLTDKATLSYGFIGTDTPPATTTRATNADTPIEPIMTTAFNTSADFGRLRIQEADETGLTTDFKSMTVTFNNQATPEKVLNLLGARCINIGNFLVTIETEALFTSADVTTAIRNNDTVGFDMALRNDNGAIFIDVPEMTLGDGSKNFPVNETVTITLAGTAHQSAVFGNSLSTTIFPFIPVIA